MMLNHTHFNPVHGRKLTTVTQSHEDFEHLAQRLRKVAAFEEWRKKLKRGDRLPRGHFFKGKTAGQRIFAMDEFWRTTH